jgi:two-component system sensor histidine kinase YesM
MRARTAYRQGDHPFTATASKARRRFADLSLFYKFFFGILAIALFVLLLSGAASYTYSRNIFKDQAILSTERLVSNINTGFEDNLDQLDRLIMSIYAEVDSEDTSSNLKEILTTPNYRNLEEQYQALRSMQVFFQRHLILRKDLNSVYLYVSPAKQFSYAAYGTNKLDYDPTDKDWYQQTLRAGGSTVVFAPHLPFQLNYTKLVLSYSRVIRGLTGDMTVADGIILIDLSMDAINGVVAKAGLDTRTAMQLLDHQGATVFASGEETVPLDDAARNAISEGTSGTLTITANGGKYLVAFSTLELAGWKTVTLTPYSEVNLIANKLLMFYLVLGLATLSLAVLLAFAFSRRIFKPLHELKKGMLQVKQGNFEHRLHAVSGDELGNLVFSFNSMTDKIRELIVEKYEATLAGREAEFKYLQSQINPHFIYNTLQIVSGMAIVHKAPEIRTVSTNLAKMLRYSINMNRRFVAVKEEIDNVVCYMEIQKTRFRGFFDYEIKIDEAAYTYYTLKLILQPLVENAIVHGLEPKEEGGRVVVACRAEPDRLCFEIIDSGVGMSEGTLESLRTYLDGEEVEPAGGSQGNSVGLRNIHRRVRMIYGPLYGIAIDSEQHEWTRIRLTIPLDRGGER